MTADRLSLTAEHLEAMVAHAQAELPNEACGVLGGPPGRVARVYPVPNIYKSPVAYHMDPAEQVRVMLEIEAQGWEICGIFHSHPAGPPGPSATDVALAYYPEAVYVILSREAGGQWTARGFRLDGPRPREVALDVAE